VIVLQQVKEIKMKIIKLNINKSWAAEQIKKNQEPNNRLRSIKFTLKIVIGKDYYL
jgi:hypothetical protein